MMMLSLILQGVRAVVVYLKRILSSFLDLDVFDKIYENVRYDFLFIKEQIKRFESKDWDTNEKNIILLVICSV